MLLLNLKASNLLVQTLSKTSNLETIKLVSMILSLMAQTSECQEDIIMNSCIEECLKIYRSLDQDDIKIIFIRLIANCSENELGLNKVKRLGVVQIINDEMKDCKNKTLLYHFAMAFLIFSKDVEIYRSLLRTKFLKILENLSFSHVKNDSDVYSLLFGINLFTKRATESNLSELFLVYFNP